MASKKSSGNKGGKKGPPPAAVNKRARFDYEVVDTVEAGLILVGSEVKSIRQGQMSLEESYGRFQGAKLMLIGTYIPEYSQANAFQHDPKRRRQCLLRKRELRKLKDEIGQKGLTIVPLKVYFNDRGYAKVELGICKGRQKGDKRQALKKKDDRRAMQDF